MKTLFIDNKDLNILAGIRKYLLNSESIQYNGLNGDGYNSNTKPVAYVKSSRKSGSVNVYDICELFEVGIEKVSETENKLTVVSVLNHFFDEANGFNRVIKESAEDVRSRIMSYNATQTELSEVNHFARVEIIEVISEHITRSRLSKQISDVKVDVLKSKVGNIIKRRDGIQRIVDFLMRKTYLIDGNTPIDLEVKMLRTPNRYSHSRNTDELSFTAFTKKTEDNLNKVLDYHKAKLDTELDLGNIITIKNCLSIISIIVAYYLKDDEAFSRLLNVRSSKSLRSTDIINKDVIMSLDMFRIADSNMFIDGVLVPSTGRFHEVTFPSGDNLNYNTITNLNHLKTLRACIDMICNCHKKYVESYIKDIERALFGLRYSEPLTSGKASKQLLQQRLKLHELDLRISTLTPLP